MTKVSDDTDRKIATSYYMPHHVGVKESSTTKVRVVFDGSAKSTSGICINDAQMVGCAGRLAINTDFDSIPS